MRKGKKPKVTYRNVGWWWWIISRRPKALIPHTCSGCGWVCGRAEFQPIINCPKCGPKSVKPSTQKKRP